MIETKWYNLFIILFLLFLPFMYTIFHGASLKTTVNSEEKVITLNKPSEVLSWAVLFSLVGSGSIGAIIAATGIVEFTSSRLYPNILPVPRDELERRLEELNDPEKPWSIQHGEDTDFVAEWRIVDAKWWEIFARAGLKSYYKARMLLDEVRHRVLYHEETGEIEWKTGIWPPFQLHISKFSGRIFFSKKKAVLFAFKSFKPIDWGKVYSYNFDVNMIRGPIVETVERAGWLFMPVTAKRHVTYKGK